MATLKYTPVEKIAGIVNAARLSYSGGRTREIEWRLKQVKQIKRLVSENLEEIKEALYADLRRPEVEAVVAEIHTVIAECNDVIGNIHSWVKPYSVPSPASLLPGSSFIKPDPLGVVCIIAPWNFPFQLCLNPLIAAIAAGNACVIKPSEVSPNCAILLEKLIPQYLDNDVIKIVQGGVAETTELLKQRFDHILYTGNEKVAKIVMRAAAENLTPVTLELGGKSPCIVDETANIKLATRRILSGKCLNAGQVCIAPDYVLVTEGTERKLIDELKVALVEFYGKDIEKTPDFGRMVNKMHFNRVKALLEGAKGEIVFGGEVNEADNYIAPTAILNPSLQSDLMTTEIFGPLLPIITVPSVEQATLFINQREKPLALYIFSSKSKVQQKILNTTTAGGVVINDTLLHNVNSHLPFGGVGNSGMGAYHGKFGFDTFSHKKAVFHQSTFVDTGPVRFPPYSKAKLKLIDLLVTTLPSPPQFDFKSFAILGLSVAVAVLAAKVGNQF